jgi:hypothetical protein
MKLRDLTWLVGLYEGEGSVCVFYPNKRYPKNARFNLSIKMKDQDVVRRAHAIAGVGHINYDIDSRGMWRWNVSGHSQVAQLLQTFLPLLGIRRRKRALEVLAAWRTYPLPPKDRPTCKRGHLLSGQNLRAGRYKSKTGWRRSRFCVTCGRLWRLRQDVQKLCQELRARPVSAAVVSR